MTKPFLKGCHVRAAALTLLLPLGLVLAGCYSNGPDPSAYDTRPLDANALSGGKITRFIPQAGLTHSSVDRDMLEACQQLPVTSSTARSASLVITAGRFGSFPLHALVVGKQTFILPGNLITMGMTQGLGFDRRNAAYNGTGGITIIPGSKTAIVGKKEVTLGSPAIATTSHNLVMDWADMAALLHERDVQRHEPPFIRKVQLIYDIRDYHRTF